jgi:hypothetical protein
MKTTFKHCSIIFHSDIENFNKTEVIFERPGEESIIFDKFEFTDILNSLIATQKTINSKQTISIYSENIDTNFVKPLNEVCVLAIKINTDVKISIMGFRHYANSTTERVFKIPIDKDDNIFQLTGDFLCFLNQTDHNGKLSIQL